VGPPRDGRKPLSEPGRGSDVGPNVPSGTDVHAFLIADVRGYTSFTQERGDEDAGRLAARFAVVARAVVEEHQGEVLELRGDEALCVFVAIVAASLVVAAVIAVPALVRNAGAGSEIEPNSVGVLDPSSGELTDTIGMASRPGAITAGSGSLWATNPDAETVIRIDQGSRAVVDTIPVGAAPAGVAAGDGAVWVVESGGPSVSRISPKTNEVVATVPVGNGPVSIAVGEGAVWVTNRFDGTVTKIDPDRAEG
jgi:YVTN family beta-propeller protein